MIATTLANELLTHGQHALAAAVHADDLNPAPKPPKGVGSKVSDLMGNVKWGSMVVIIAAGFIGAGAVAGGKFLSHHKTSQFGVGVLISAACGAVLWVGVYAFLKGIMGF